MSSLALAATSSSVSIKPPTNPNIATKFAYAVMDHFNVMPSFIDTEQEFYDYWVPFFFLLSFFVSLP